MNEKKPEDACGLNDEDLKEAVGGASNQTYWRWNGGFYKWQGSSDGKDCNERYLCPHCGGPLHLDDYGWYACDSCCDDWWYEDDLVPNVKNWHYREITQWDYAAREHD